MLILCMDKNSFKRYGCKIYRMKLRSIMLFCLYDKIRVQYFYFFSLSLDIYLEWVYFLYIFSYLLLFLIEKHRSFLHSLVFVFFHCLSSFHFIIWYPSTDSELWLLYLLMAEIVDLSRDSLSSLNIICSLGTQEKQIFGDQSKTMTNTSRRWLIYF